MSSWRASSGASGRLATAALLLAFFAPIVAAQESGVVERLFVARAEQPGVALQVTSLRGGDVYEGSTDAQGLLVFRLEVADSDEIRFVSGSETWQLDWVATVRNAHLDPEIPLELDIGAFLRRAEVPPPAPAESPDGGSAPAGREEAKAGVAGEDDLRCRSATDMRCLLRLQRRLAEAEDRGDCRQALTLAQQLQDDLPDFAASDAGAMALASLNFRCAFVEIVDDDPYVRRDLLLRRAVALAAGANGAGWCDAERSWILAAAHASLRETAAAAASARRARELCPANPAPYEWEFYFRLGLGQVSRAAEVATETESAAGSADDGLARLAEFLGAWSAHAAGRCPDVATWLRDTGDTPCSVLPAGTCARARTSWILRCGDEVQLASYAESLRASLDDGSRPAAWQIEDLAEMESARGRWAESANLYERLLARFASDESASRGRRGGWACRRGDALLRAGRPEAALAAFEAASGHWHHAELSASRLDRLVVENNALVLASQVRGEVDESRFASVSERLEALSQEEALAPWRLAVENNLLELRTRADAEQAAFDPIAARDALERLRAVESAYRRHVESVVLQPALAPGTGTGTGTVDSAEDLSGDVAEDVAQGSARGAEVAPPCSRLAMAGELGQEVEAADSQQQVEEGTASEQQ